MTERWVGEFTYGETFSKDLQDKSISFYIDWIIKDGVLEGNCIDEENKDVFDKPATINGFLENNIISFIKKYPSYCQRDANGNVQVFKDIPPTEIHYYGVYVDDHFEGDWDMSVACKLRDGKIEQFDYTGTWTLKSG